MITKAKVILVTQLVTLVLANVSTFDKEVSDITEMQEVADPMADDSSMENAMDTSETHHRRFYYPKVYNYPRYPQYYAPNRRYYNNNYRRPQYNPPNHAYHYRPAYRPSALQPHNDPNFWAWINSLPYTVGNSVSSDVHIPDPPPVRSDPPHIPNDPPIIHVEPPHIPEPPIINH